MTQKKSEVTEGPGYQRLMRMLRDFPEKPPRRKGRKSELEAYRRVDSAFVGLRNSLWRYALSYGECATPRQVVELEIFPKKENAVAIEADIGVVCSCFAEFKTVGTLTPDRLNELTSAEIHIMGHLQIREGKARLLDILREAETVGARFNSNTMLANAAMFAISLVMIAIVSLVGMVVFGMAIFSIVLFAGLASQKKIKEISALASIEAATQHATPIEVLHEMP